jgi:hypothetical protein
MIGEERNRILHGRVEFVYTFETHRAPESEQKDRTQPNWNSAPATAHAIDAEMLAHPARTSRATTPDGDAGAARRTGAAHAPQAVS